MLQIILVPEGYGGAEVPLGLCPIWNKDSLYSESSVYTNLVENINYCRKRHKNLICYFAACYYQINNTDI